MEILTIESLGPKLDAEARAALADADLIIGVDAAAQGEFTVYGTPSLESSGSIKRPSAMHTVRVLIDCKSGDLAQLVALVQAIKGGRSG
jgi:hypothetical protein